MDFNLNLINSKTSVQLHQFPLVAISTENQHKFQVDVLNNLYVTEKHASYLKEVKPHFLSCVSATAKNLLTR